MTKLTIIHAGRADRDHMRQPADRPDDQLLGTRANFSTRLLSGPCGVAHAMQGNVMAGD